MSQFGLPDPSHESDERGPLYLHRLTSPVIQGDHKVEEVGLAQITGWLLLEVGPSNSNAETENGNR